MTVLPILAAGAFRSSAFAAAFGASAFVEGDDVQEAEAKMVNSAK
jgi:NAD-dependent oxidoreductase involved in siderophore biosynthesis